MHDRVRSTVLAGWLGSGKTTLLNELLGSIDGERVAVIVNDVGDVNVDAALIERVDGDRIELTDGCICCSIGSSLALTLRDLVMVDHPPDRIVIEASGVAEPARVAEYGDRRRIEAPSIVVTVDATDVVERSSDLRYGPMVRTQVAQADMLVITKTDLIGDDQLDRVMAWLGTVAPATPIVDRDTALTNPMIGASAPSATIGDRHQVENYTVDFGDDIVDIAVLERELRRTPELLRAKGVVRRDDGSHLLVNFAADRFDSAPHDGAVDPSVAQRLVVIVADGQLDAADLDRRLHSCIIHR